MNNGIVTVRTEGKSAYLVTYLETYLETYLVTYLETYLESYLQVQQVSCSPWSHMAPYSQ